MKHSRDLNSALPILHSALRRLVALVVAEVFLCSMILPAWAIPSPPTNSMLRPVTAKDGGTATDLSQELNPMQARDGGGKSERYLVESIEKALRRHREAVRVYREMLMEGILENKDDIRWRRSQEILEWLENAMPQIEKKGILAFMRSTTIPLRKNEGLSQLTTHFEEVGSALIEQPLRLNRRQIFIVPKSSPWLDVLGFNRYGTLIITGKYIHAKVPKERMVFLLEQPGEVASGALIHELWHFAGVLPRISKDAYLGSFLSEGVTEYLTRRTIQQMGLKSDHESYHFETAFAKVLSEQLGPNGIQILFRVFTQADTAPLKKVFGERAGLFSKMLTRYNTRGWEFLSSDVNPQLRELPLLILEDTTFRVETFEAFEKVLEMLIDVNDPTMGVDSIKIFSDHGVKEKDLERYDKKLDRALRLYWTAPYVKKLAEEMIQGKKRDDEIFDKLAQRYHEAIQALLRDRDQPDGQVPDGGHKTEPQRPITALLTQGPTGARDGGRKTTLEQISHQDLPQASSLLQEIESRSDLLLPAQGI